MNIEIEKGKEEFENRNYDEALAHFEKVDENDWGYDFAQLFKANCLMKLERYEDALVTLDSVISNSPSNKHAWFCKVSCLIFSSEDDEKALKSIDELLVNVNIENEHDFIFLAKSYNLLHHYEEALKYCDMALEIDDEFIEALYEKALIALRIDDSDIIDQVSEKLLEIREGDLLGLLPIFMMKLFSKDYSFCLDLVKNGDFSDFDDEHIEMLKAVIYKQICEDHSVNLLVLNEGEISVDEALNALIEFVEKGKAEGDIGDVHYFVL